MKLELDESDRIMLVEILEEHNRELLLEISHADHQEYRRRLRDRQRRVESLLTRLAVPITSAA